MSRPSIMLRLMIALLLVLNGASGASASVRMSLQHGAGDMTQAVASTASEQKPACHEDMAASHDTVPQQSAPDPHSAEAECCAGDSCLCACVLHCSFVPVASVLAPTQVPGRPAMLWRSAGNPEPIRTHLIRPPIR